MHSFIRGSSSLFFIISTMKAFYSSKLLLYKLSNVFLVVASYLCNSSNFNEPYLLIDLVAIITVASCYINHFYINSALFSAVVFEYNRVKYIQNTKNLTLFLACLKSCYYTYHYVDNAHFFVLISSWIIAASSYQLRYYLITNKINKYNLLLTYLLHISVTNTIYISSITAV
jgi:hypothetical protein